MTSEFHRQEALQSLDVAKKALKEKNIEKAKRFALKAQKLCNCSEVEEFLKELGSTPVTSPPSSSSGVRPNLKKRAPRDNNGERGTEEQRLLIAKINRAKDYYEILDISRECAEDDVKKSYRKLALKLHPDKNKAPGAEEAFKAVSRAFSCLSDEEKRRNYDTYGTEERMQTTRPTYYHHNAFQDDFDPQEIFNMFFGGQFPMHNAGIHRAYYHRPHPRRPPSTEGQNGSPDNNAGFKTLIRLLPLVLLLAFSFFSSAPAPAYSLYRDYTYRDKVVTVMHQIPFFVKSQTQFDKTYPDGTLGRRQVEDQVEATYRAILEAQCREEKVKKRRLQAWHGKEKAEKYLLNSCIELRERFQSTDRKRTATRVH